MKKGEIMEGFKGRMFAGLGILVFLICCGLVLYHFENYEEIFYTRVDNTKVHKLTEIASQDMPYEYKLACYNEDGKMKEFTFKTVRELREDAYLSLTVKMTGVNSWAEVTYEELPNKVQNKYEN